MNSQQFEPSPKMVVVPHNPRRLPLLVLAWLISILLALAVAVTSTSIYSRAKIKDLQMQSADLYSQLQASEARSVELQQQVTNYRLSSDIDKQASQDVRKTVVELQNRITALEEEISFYRGLMDPSSSQQGVGFGEVLITQSADSERFQYRVVVQQVAANHKLFSGSLVVALVGRVNGQQQTLSLSSVSEQVADKSIKLRFKYFQIIEGDILLPKGFVPEALEMEINAGRQGVVSKQFDWQIQES